MDCGENQRDPRVVDLVRMQSASQRRGNGATDGQDDYEDWNECNREVLIGGEEDI